MRFRASQAAIDRVSSGRKTPQSSYRPDIGVKLLFRANLRDGPLETSPPSGLVFDPRDERDRFGDRARLRAVATENNHPGVAVFHRQTFVVLGPWNFAEVLQPAPDFLAEPFCCDRRTIGDSFSPPRARSMSPASDRYCDIRRPGFPMTFSAPGMWLIAYSVGGQASNTTALPSARMRRSSSVLKARPLRAIPLPKPRAR